MSLYLNYFNFISTTLSLLALFAIFSSPIHAQENTPPIELRGVAEIGTLYVAHHTIQFSNDGTRIDYTEDAGQDVLFPFTRFSLDAALSKRHTITFLYQPLELETTELLQRDITVDSLTFPKDTPVTFTYGFPFYRLSYTYNLRDHPRDTFALGGGLQLRNATISFISPNGDLFRTNRSLGPVPLLKLRTRNHLSPNVFIGAEIDGLYAPISVLNGSDNEVVGAILDASVRVGVHLSPHTTSFLNLRYLAGGAVGTSEPDSIGSDGYVRNWLHFLTLSIGFEQDFAALLNPS